MSVSRSTIGLLVGGLFVYFLILLVSLPPGPVAGDGAELIYGMSTLQEVHAPGYPLYLLIGYGLNQISASSAPVVAHFLSALFSILSMSGLFFLMKRMRVSTVPSLLSMFLLGVSYPIWDLSVTVEVYTLACLFMIGTLLLADVVRTSHRGRSVLWFWVGLSLTHHPLAIFNVLVAVWVTYHDSRPFGFLEASVLVSPLSLYGILLLPGYGFPFDWPQVGSIGALIPHVLGGGMLRFVLNEGIFTIVLQLRRVLLAHFGAFPILVGPVVLLGYIGGYSNRKTRELIYFQLVFLGVLLIYGIPDINEFLLPSYFLSAIFLGLGLEWIRQYDQRSYWITVVVCFLSVLGFTSLMGVRYDRSEFDFPRRYVASVDKRVTDGVVLSDWSHYTLLRYYQLTEDKLKNVDLYSPTHNYGTWDQIAEDHLTRNRPVYLTIDDWDPPDKYEIQKSEPVYRLKTVSNF